MRDFQDYTKTSRAARWQRLVWSVSIGLVVAALVVGLGMRAVSTPLETLGYGADGGSGAEGDGVSHGGWLRGILGGSDEVTDGPLNVLVLGVDKRPPGSKEAQVEGVRTDTVMLVQVVPGTGEVKLLSVPRDLLVEIEPGVEDKITPKYEIKDGLQTLNGAQALFYARYRGTARGDLDRIEHQQRLIAALRSKALGWDTVTRLPQIARVMNRNVETNLDFDEALSLGRVLISRGRNARMTVSQLKGTPKTLPNGNEVLVPNEAANEAFLAEFRY